MSLGSDQLADAFAELLECSQAEQKQRLDEIGGQDCAAADELKSLLRAHQAAPNFLKPMDGIGIAELLDADDRDQMPAHAGPWRLLRELGRGGLGVVYLAERKGDDFEQRVAIKLIKRGMDSDAILKRFENERRFLATLDHPNIARLIDGSVLDDGRPWFAMDYVEGKTITDWCEQKALSIRARIHLFQQVSRAVQAAHAKLIVHRDLKPGNILVTPDGQVKLLDFGIAKLIDPDLAHSLELTRLGAAVMTPEYAAPEQIEGQAITVATDVYALGVVLYELLCGRHPYRDQAETRESLQQAVRNSSPLPPSTVAGRLETGDPRIGQMRPAGLRKQLRGDLDAIVLTAMARSPERRYPSVEALTEDIQRHLEGLPIRARARSRAYRTGRFLRRHRIGVSAVAAVVMALSIGLGVALWQASEARHQAMLAEQSREFVISLMTEIAPSRSDEGVEMSAVDLLLRAADQVEAADDLAPVIQGRLAGVIAEVLVELGSVDRALTLAELGVERLEAARNRDDGLLANNLSILARMQVSLGRGDDAEASVERGLELIDQVSELSNADRLTRVELLEMQARTFGNRYDSARAIALRERALQDRMALFSGNDVRIAAGHHNLATELHTAGQFQDAEYHYGEVGRIIKLIDTDHPRIANVQMGLGAVLIGQGRFEDAEDALMRALAMAEARYGADSGLVASCRAHLGHLRRHQGRFQDAYELFTQVATKPQGSRASFANAVASSWLGSLALSLNRPLDAIDHFQRIQATMTELGQQKHAHQMIATLGESLANLRTTGDQPDLAGAEDTMNQLLDLGAGPTQTHAEGAELMAALLRDLGHYNDADHWQAQAKTLFSDHFGPDHPRTLGVGALYSQEASSIVSDSLH